jgi:lysophospholipase L1-like esterase
MKLTRITSFLFVTLILSLIANWIIYQRGEQYYLLFNSVQLDPLGMGLYPVDEDRPVLADDQKLVVFYGDSRAFHWPFPRGLTQFQFINRAGAGQTSEQIVGRFDVHVRSLQPNVVILQVGINDLKTIGLFPRQQRAIIENCKENIQEMLMKSLDLGATVILTTIFPQGRIPLERRLFWSPEVATGEQEVNAFIFSLADENVIVFDTSKVLSGENGIVRTEYSEDFLHLNETGYQALNAELEKILIDIPEE